MARTVVIVKMSVEVAHVDGLGYRNLHQAVKSTIDAAIEEGQSKGQGYITILSHKVQSVAHAGPNQETRWR